MMSLRGMAAEGTGLLSKQGDADTLGKVLSEVPGEAESLLLVSRRSPRSQPVKELPEPLAHPPKGLNRKGEKAHRGRMREVGCVLALLDPRGRSTSSTRLRRRSTGTLRVGDNHVEGHSGTCIRVRNGDIRDEVRAEESCSMAKNVDVLDHMAHSNLP
jgi:hypothetical protein